MNAINVIIKSNKLLCVTSYHSTLRKLYQSRTPQRSLYNKTNSHAPPNNNANCRNQTFNLRNIVGKQNKYCCLIYIKFIYVGKHQIIILHILLSKSEYYIVIQRCNECKINCYFYHFYHYPIRIMKVLRYTNKRLLITYYLDLTFIFLNWY